MCAKFFDKIGIKVYRSTKEARSTLSLFLPRHQNCKQSWRSIFTNSPRTWKTFQLSAYPFFFFYVYLLAFFCFYCILWLYLNRFFFFFLTLCFYSESWDSNLITNNTKGNSRDRNDCLTIESFELWRETSFTIL